LDMIDKAVLDFFSFGQIQLQIDHSGLNIFVSQFIADIRDWLTVSEHFNRTGMAEAMNRIDIF